MTYETFFRHATGFAAPRPWQAKLAANDACTSRLVNIPTGLGKTEAVTLAASWLPTLDREMVQQVLPAGRRPPVTALSGCSPEAT